jgi:hypothetical protein
MATKYSLPFTDSETRRAFKIFIARAKAEQEEPQSAPATTMPSRQRQAKNRQRALEALPDCKFCGISQALCRCT